MPALTKRNEENVENKNRNPKDEKDLKNNIYQRREFFISCEVFRNVRLVCTGVVQVPLVVRLEGTNVENGRDLLKNSGLRIISCQTIDEAAARAVEEAKAYRSSHVGSR